jgi:hypothetical protein
MKRPLRAAEEITMSTLPNMPDAKQLLAMAPLARDPQCVEAIVQQHETHQALVKRLAKERLAAKIDSASERDFRDAAITAFADPLHIRALKLAFDESAEAFGDALQNMMRDEWALQASIEAVEIALRIEGAQPAHKPLHQFIRIVGDQS